MKRDIEFSKMHGLGNDFVIINLLDHPIEMTSLPIEKLAHRYLGIGFDQLITIEPSTKADFFCRIFNADGTQAEQCGNGLRAVARFLHEEKKVASPTFTLETIAGVFPVLIKDYNHIRLTLNSPEVLEKELKLPFGTITIISTGNPHAILKVEDIDGIAVTPIAALIAAEPHFTHGVNVGFLQVLTKRQARLRTVERGVGETLACGSNACAAAAAGIVNDWLENPVTIEFRHGSLTIEWEGPGKPLHMTGPATLVFKGIIPPAVLAAELLND